MTSQHISQHVERDAELAEPFQTSVLAAMKDPNMADFFLRDKDGNHMTCTVFCRSMYAFLVVVVVVVVVVGGGGK